MPVQQKLKGVVNVNWLLVHVHGTVYLSSSLTAHYLSPSGNTSKLSYLKKTYLLIISFHSMNQTFDCVKCP